MANKKIIIKFRNAENTAWEEHYPKTKGDVVYVDRGSGDELLNTVLVAVMSALGGKSDTVHTHASYLGVNANAVSASKLLTARTISLTGDVTGSVSFDGAGNVSMNCTVGNYTHNHNTLYYTTTQVNSLLTNKSNTDHIHDDRYYGETEISILLSSKSNTNHVHDDLYLTEAETIALIATHSSNASIHVPIYVQADAPAVVNGALWIDV